eukprot:s1073_g4.t1
MISMSSSAHVGTVDFSHERMHQMTNMLQDTRCYLERAFAMVVRAQSIHRGLPWRCRGKLHLPSSRQRCWGSQKPTCCQLDTEGMKAIEFCLLQPTSRIQPARLDSIARLVLSVLAIVIGAEVDSLVVRETPRYSALTVESPTPGTDEFTCPGYFRARTCCQVSEMERIWEKVEDMLQFIIRVLDDQGRDLQAAEAEEAAGLFHDDGSPCSKYQVQLFHSRLQGSRAAREATAKGSSLRYHSFDSHPLVVLVGVDVHVRLTDRRGAGSPGASYV